MTSSVRPAVTVTAHPVWRLRLRREAPRRLLQALAVWGLLASARYAIDPPLPRLPHMPASSAAQSERASEAFALLFARRYLTWDAADPEAHRQALEPYTGQLEAEVGFQPPPRHAQSVQWMQVAQALPGERYTIAAQTDTSGLVYLSVGVRRLADGALALSGYPAFVGPPPIAPAAAPPSLSEATDRSLGTVAARALRNYLAGQASELAADLAPGARASPLADALTLESIDALDWLHAGRSLYALVHAGDRAGGRYALAYRLGVADAAGRWEITAIELASGSD